MKIKAFIENTAKSFGIELKDKKKKSLKSLCKKLEEKQQKLEHKLHKKDNKKKKKELELELKIIKAHIKKCKLALIE